MQNNNFNESFVPAIIYNNPETDKSIILTATKGKAGIYLWKHNESGKKYVGSAVNLSRRLRTYYIPSELKRIDNYISRAIILHNHSAFSLAILEHIDISNLSKENARKLILEREQYYIDSFNPEYNILLIAGSTLGFIHTVETKTLISKARKGKFSSAETKAKLREAKTGEKNPNFGKTHTAETKAKLSVANLGKSLSIETKAKIATAKGIPIFVYNLDGSLINEFFSAKEAGKYFKVDSKTILNYCLNGKLLKKQWILSMSKK
jgi:group I intron endonuclease